MSGNREVLTKLTALLKELYWIVAGSPADDMTYAKESIFKMVEFLEAELQQHTVEYEELLTLLMKKYKTMFPPKAGLSEFYIWDDNYEIRCRKNEKYENLLEQIETLLSSKPNTI